MAVSSVRAPRLDVLLNGIALAGVIDAEISSIGHYAADRFRLRVALSANAASVWAQTPMAIELRVSLGSGLVSLVQGNVDRLDIDPIRHEVELEGRDLTASLIEARTQEAFVNQTSSQIATLLAGRHGLTANITPTSVPVGRYYQSEHSSITLGQFARATTEWDLLIYLAQREGFEVWVQGSTLYFNPVSIGSMIGMSVSPSDCIDLRLSRALTLARDITVVVKSWNSRQKKAFTETARHSSGSGGGQSALTYVYVMPNLTPADALARAQQILAELSQHERNVDLTMPGELTLAPRAPVTLLNTGTDFDGTYEIASVTRRLSERGGFVQTVRARTLAWQAPSQTGSLSG